MDAHEQAVEELMELGWSEEEAEQMVELEEVGFVMDVETGAILPDVDPDTPIDMSPFQEDTVQWN